VKATSSDPPDRARRLDNLGIWLGTRFDRTKAVDDLNHAVEATDKAVKTIPSDHPDRAGYLNNLGIWLGRRFERTRAMDDLNHAVEASDEAVKATPSDYPYRANLLNHLGSWLGRRFERTEVTNDLHSSLSTYKEGWNCHSAPPSDRIRPARNAARILASLSNWEESSWLLCDAVKLLPTVSPRSLQHSYKATHAR
jgi:Tetratricopeptide repeat